MPEVELISLFPARLNQAHLDYMVTGSIAAMVYGEPRLTHDIDLVLSLSPPSIASLTEAFPPSEYYCPPIEVIRIELSRKIHGHFNLIHHASGLKADIYPIGDDSLHRWAFPLRRKVVYDEREIWLAPPEYVIARKCQYYQQSGSEKHLEDVRAMLSVSNSLIDFDVLVKKIMECHLESTWDQVKNSAR